MEQQSTTDINKPHIDGTSKESIESVAILNNKNKDSEKRPNKKTSSKSNSKVKIYDCQLEGGESQGKSLIDAEFQKKLQKSKRTFVYALCIVAFLSMSSLAQLSPFYPLKAKEKGVSIIYIGFVLGFFAILQIVSSTIFGKKMHKFKSGRHWFIIFGAILIMCQIAMMGLIDYIPKENTNWFLACSFFAQGIGGFGAGADMTACMAILAGFDGKEREMYIGWIEASNGLGLLFGPLIGAACFSFGGYKAPFLFFSILFLLLFPCICGALFKYNRLKKEMDEMMGVDPDAEVEEKAAVQLWPLFKHARFIFGLMAQCLLLMSVQFLAPNLALHLQAFGYPPMVIGCAYAIPGVLYACTCPFIYLLTQKIRKRGVICIGFMMVTLAMQMIGGSNTIFEFQKQPVYIFLGLVLIGLSCGMISIPVLPEMLECIEEDDEVMNKYDIETIENTISGLFITFQSIGEAGGPILASTLSYNYGFTFAQEVYSGILFGYVCLYVICCGHYRMFMRETKYDDLDEEAYFEEQGQLVKPQEESIINGNH